MGETTGVRPGDSMEMRCGVCGHEFAVTVGEAMHPCPGCQADAHRALRVLDDVEVKVNWHELRILGMWAERWAAEYGDKDPEMQRTVALICGRLHAQHPERSGLTFSSELAELRQMPEVGDVEVRGFNEDGEANANG